MAIHSTPYGTLRVLPKDSLFQYIARTINDCLTPEKPPATPPIIALTGGSTPKTFYNWAMAHHAISTHAAANGLWITSDERMVPITHAESNFGNADRLLLNPLGVPDRAKLPWPVYLEAAAAANQFNRHWQEQFGPHRSIDLCFLGMGDDGHIASLFPKSRLIGAQITEPFTNVDVPGKGPRLTITEHGLGLCKQIIVVVTGHSKAQMLQSVLKGEHQPQLKPAQLLKNWASKVTWLADTHAMEISVE